MDKSLVNRLNKRVELQEKTKTFDGFGGYIEEWTTVQKLWAEVMPVDAIENFEANKIDEKISHIISIRYKNTISTHNRLKFNERIFNIRGIVNVNEENRILEIKAEEDIKS